MASQQGIDEPAVEEFINDTEDAEERERAHRERGTSRPITVVGNPVLHRECQDVTVFDEELAALIDDMFASQRTAEGVGLAANQIGVDRKVFVYDCPDDEGVRHVGAVCNPVLEELPAERRVLDESNEGCLSVPTAYASLARPDYAVVSGQDAAGNPIRIEGTGYFARCLQHETDHLYGRLYIDRLSKRDRKDALQQMAEGTPRYATVPNE
ncbi:MULTISPECIES: peptide deformylase [Streptomyces]|uniref:Peptide deformylase n=1 Tax=Streptomyces tsukubensis (strain DSM 42081 / NBRC 108919 / NRRL 18488 / 9993) TaxID=1114943 RepID=I2N5X3_STRT9|nr:MULTISPECIES: peptide deformylase [Streptomyces]AZK96416.1 peptide deformylase [Streptomyces tsukubensis]EIF92420.1 peptide deformylase [Streptomyces tsukubensis NRRL18488]MYS67772.1 peptide deformylase [Streptomyces sp. SID5473]QKM67581.1 peptide deformylase [Streptomyces tsukubensis NRRL18488]TAI43975.1 peptide deformylase [Streptomyces tsukubensis]